MTRLAATLLTANRLTANRLTANRLTAYRLLASLLLASLFLCGCVHNNSVPAPAPTPADAKPLLPAVKSLANELVSSPRAARAGKVAVADFTGPGNGVTPLGEHVADKLGVVLFQGGTFQDMMERRQLKQILLSRKLEMSGYFDQESVQRFGKLLGVDSMVIGRIKDLGPVYDVTARLVQSGTGRLLAAADTRVMKDAATQSMAAMRRAGALTVSVEPARSGTVTACGRTASLVNGVATIGAIPYGECDVLVNPSGYETQRRSVDIHGAAQTISVILPEKTFSATFTVIPPDAELIVDGLAVPLSPEGFARLEDLSARDYPYMVKARGYEARAATFNPGREPNLVVTLAATDEFYLMKSEILAKAMEAMRSPDFPIQVWTDRTDYRLGDPIRFSFRTSRDCYLNLINVTEDGQARLIFPNRYQSDNHVLAGRTYSIPSVRDDFELVIEPPVGTERVIAIASVRPLDIFGSDFSGDSFISYERGRTKAIATRAVGVRMKRARLNSARQCVIHITR